MAEPTHRRICTSVFRGKGITEQPVFGDTERKSGPENKTVNVGQISNVSKVFGVREQTSVAFVEHGVCQYQANNDPVSKARFNRSWFLNLSKIQLRLTRFLTYSEINTRNRPHATEILGVLGKVVIISGLIGMRNMQKEANKDTGRLYG
jgi:hypothetical protein